MMKQGLIIFSIVLILSACNAPKRYIKTSFIKLGIELPDKFEVLKHTNSPAIGDLVVELTIKIENKEMSQICKKLRSENTIQDSIYNWNETIAYKSDEFKKVIYKTDHGYNLELFKPGNGFEYYFIQIDTINNTFQYLYQDE